MNLHDLQKAEGSTRGRRRLRGHNKGGQSGRGHKGQRARAGSKRKAWHEGGQMPYIRRIPKRGFISINKTEYQLVKIGEIAKKFTDPGEIYPATLKAAGLIKSVDKPVKIMGEGSLGIGLTIYAQAFTRSAAEIISKAGGKAEKI